MIDSQSESSALFSLKNYQFDLPQDLIAQKPSEPKDACRLMVVERKSGTITEVPFFEISNLVKKGDSFIANESRVICARLLGRKTTGARIEALLVEKKEKDLWLALTKPASKLKIGSQIIFEGGLEAEVVAEVSDGEKLLHFLCPDSDALIEKVGHMPLPPYIRGGQDTLEDRLFYQTVFAKVSGSIAAPTAGLHFTDALLEKVKTRGVSWHTIVLHVGLGTFLPIRTDDIRQHKMHSESYFIPQSVADAVNNRSKENLQIFVGTTTLRTLESSVDSSEKVQPGAGSTSLFIYPGYNFKCTQSLLTNFHLPGSSLFVLVSAFLAPDLAQEVYRKAIEKRFAFYSYGDAMLCLP